MADFVDKAQHKAEELTGQAKEKVGDATGNDNLRSDGAADQVKAKARQVGDTLSDGVDALQDKSSDAVDKAATATSKAADAVTDLADSAAKKAREADIEVNSIVDTATSPRVFAAAAIAGVGLVALVLYRRNRRQNVPQVVAQTRRAAKKLAKSSRR